MNFSPHGKTIIKVIIAVIVSTITNIPCAILFFFIGLKMLFTFFTNSYDTNYFLIAGLMLMSLLYIAVSAIIGIIFYKLTKFKKFAVAFSIVGILFAFLVGFPIYSYIKCM